MSKRDDIVKIWQESFSDSREYVRMYFDRVYRDEEALALADSSGQTVSSLLLQRYRMSFHGSEIPVSYIAGAATRRQQRGKGYMSQLMADALKASAARGDMLCSLIPSRNALYYYYRKFGFSTVFYTKEQRFTSAHSFPVQGCYHADENASNDEIWQAFDRFQRMRRCYIMHSRRDFDNILADLAMDGGKFVVMSCDDEDCGPHIVSMAWAVMKDDLLLVTDLMGETEDARTAALHRMRELYPGVPFLVYGRPTDTIGGRLMPRGMGRIVNAGLLLEKVAEAYGQLVCAVRVTDRILPDYNSHIFLLKNGHCNIDDDYPLDKLDFDVTAEILAEIAFSAPSIGEILRFPSERPMISLMLD